MIKNLFIENFEGYKKVNLNFSTGVNILTGVSDSGKSSVYRAIEWVTMNQPAGEDFISHWADQSRVILEFDNGNKVERVKGKKCNSYFLNDQEYKSFGQGVPEDIQKVVNMESINFKSQFASPFLLSQTSGEVTKYFNSIVNLEDIDTTFRNGKKEIRELNTKIPFIEEEIQEQKNELEKYSWVEDA
jgi:exonuclease SbcC